ncbi:rRNA maturation RNAse YbeY [Patescibacteria group bacterium]|nr:rRNA maturation RNAse YbeY [Patescibacteria group bacterium]MBU2632944.1 rRNA maturation RNAse YbeY [Patescibacteria group bacterium]
MLDIINLTKRKTPKLPWKKIAETILEKNYALSVILTGDALIRKLNKTYRKKGESTNTLSFRFAENEGEIFLNAKYPKEELFFLFIHSLLHLKGFEHGKKMLEQEKKYLTKFIK